jgi:serine/threonine protein kinase
MMTSITLVKQVLASRYEILDELGRGGMANVYKAIQRNLNRPVAIKVIHQNFVHDTEFIARFHREAQLCSSLNHPNIVTIFDEGEINGIHFMVMEFLDGVDLHHLIQQNGRLTPEMTIEYLKPIASALGHAHQHGLIHRDIKSSNIIITNTGRPVLTDFGIAFAINESKLTQPGTVIGTPEYMSPEQAEGKQIDHRSDLFSLGVILYECLSGQVPFKGDNPISTVHKIIYEQPLPIVQFANDIPEWLVRTTEYMLQKNPDQRLQNGAEVESYLSGNSIPGSKGRRNQNKIRTKDKKSVKEKPDKQQESTDVPLKYGSSFSMKILLFALVGIIVVTALYFLKDELHIDTIYDPPSGPTELPGYAGIISGKQQVDAEATGVIYSVTRVKNVTRYEWLVPASVKITDGQGTNRITVEFTNMADTGTISVRGVNDAGKGNLSPALQFTVIKKEIESIEKTTLIPVEKTTLKPTEKPALKSAEKPALKPEKASPPPTDKSTSGGKIYKESELTEKPDFTVGKNFFISQITSGLNWDKIKKEEYCGFTVKITIEKDGSVLPQNIDITCPSMCARYRQDIKNAIISKALHWIAGKKNGVAVRAIKVIDL